MHRETAEKSELKRLNIECNKKKMKKKEIRERELSVILNEVFGG